MPETTVTETWPSSTPEPPPIDVLAEAAHHQIVLSQTAIARDIADFEKLIVEARGFAPEAEIAEAFCRAFPPSEPGYMAQLRSSLGVGPGVLQGFLVMFDARRLSDATARVAWLAQRLGKFKIDDCPKLGRRTYDFGRFKFCVFFNSYDDKTVCKFVEVGKKEEPIYKLMCGDEVLAQEPAERAVQP